MGTRGTGEEDGIQGKGKLRQPRWKKREREYMAVEVKRTEGKEEIERKI